MQAIPGGYQVNRFIRPNLSLEISHLKVVFPFPYYFNIFCGLLLSNGWIYTHHKINSIARFKFRTPYKNKEYAYSLYREISLFCEKSPYRYTEARDNIDEILIATKWLHFLAQIYHLFYVEYDRLVPSQSYSVRRKKIVRDNIYDLLTPLALVHWVKSSGVKLKGRGLMLYIDKDYDIIDTVKLINVLMIKYRLQCNIKSLGGSKNRFAIYINRSSFVLLDNYLAIK